MNQAELLSDVREAFEELEAAISSGNPERCHRYVTPALYEQVVGTVRDLAVRGHRRVHGAFEIASTELVELDSTGAFSLRARVRVHATSSLLELDRSGHVVGGSDQLMAWTQDVLTERPLESERWLLSEFGEMLIAGPVQGPAGQPITTLDASSLETKERESIEHAAAFVRSGLNFIAFQYGPVL